MMARELIENLVTTSATSVAKWPLWLKYVSVFLLISAAAAFTILRWGVTHEIETGLVTKTRGLQDSSPDPLVDNLWFLPDGRLVGTLKQTGPKLVVSIWDPRTFKSELRTFDVPLAVDAIKRFARRGDEGNLSGEPQTAVMRDGSKMVIYMAGYLGLFRNDEVAQPDDITIVQVQSSDPFTNSDDRVLTVTDNGQIALADSPRNRQPPKVPA